MRKLFSLFTVFLTILPFAGAQQPASQAASGPLTGRWILTGDYVGTTVTVTLNLKQDGNHLTGDLDGDKLEGTLTGDTLKFLAKDDQGGSEDVTATVHGNTMSGKAVFTDSTNPTHPVNVSFTAELVQPRRSGLPQRHEFTPTVFYRQFSAANPPVLHIAPGDTVHTTTVDAGGTDEHGVPRVLGGNPETGPFYVESAAPGDTLVVHITRLRLNRDWAVSDDAIVDRALNSDLAVKMKDGGKGIRWHLDLTRGVATPEKTSEHMANYTVPLKPMLGCVGVGRDLSAAPPNTGDSGNFGGNMDFNEIVEGVTVYLPVHALGAYLYVGDGHAVQGDGELNGNALETSMDVEFTVDVISNKHIPGPRVESPTHWMAMGLAGSIDDAFREAVSNMSNWLTDEYNLTPSEVAQVLGSSSEIKISEAADRNAGVVLKLNKDLLKGLKAPAN